uniref:Integrin alpha-6-like n=1 Tax=Acanthochromis polyacanthus TaxID=80966 RepID=A0A3Q1EUN0_9TELE
MFGLAVENIGDVNQDGYEDIAVGAPYDRSGRVFLFYGSSGRINTNPAQILSSGSKTMKLFGYSLTGNLDVDDNQYPDVAVGSLSDSIFVFRARPVVSVSTSFIITPNEINIERGGCDKRMCDLSGQACFTYTAHRATFNYKLMLSYTFEADSVSRKTRPRVDILQSSQGKLELPGQGREICTSIKMQLRRDIKDKLSRIPISVSVSLLSSSETTMTSVDQSDLTPVLNLYQKNTTISEVKLINERCGSDNICQSNLQLQYKFCSKKTQNGQDVFKSLAREDGDAVITPSDEDIALEITVTNRDGDDAHQSHAVVTLPDTLRYSTVVQTEAAETRVSCTVNDKGTLINCELGNPFKRDAEVTFYVLLSTSGISLSTKNVNVTLQLETTSVQTIQPVEALAKVVFELELRVYGLARPSQVSLGENVMGESAIKSLDQIGTSIQFEFRITNLGRPLKSFANASLNIYWPKENSVGKWILYLTRISSKDVQSVPCSPANEVNPLKDVKGWQAPSRHRREAEHEALSTDGLAFLLPRRKYETLSCSDGLQCVEIRCPLLGLDSSALLVLHSHLWNATLAEDYSSLNYLDIVVDASLSLTGSPANIGLNAENLGTKVKLTVFLERKTAFLVKVAWWIILLTVIALLLFLAVFVVLLWKRGYIQRLAPTKKLPLDEGPNTETAPLKG